MGLPKLPPPAVKPARGQVWERNFHPSTEARCFLEVLEISGIRALIRDPRNRKETICRMSLFLGGSRGFVFRFRTVKQARLAGVLS